MRFVFVNLPNTAAGTADLAPPLWALILAGIAAEEGANVRVLDLNLELLENPALAGEDVFYDWAAAKVLACGPDAVAFSSMAVNSHVAMRIAESAKRYDPHVLTFFGGPHFSAIATELMRRCPWMDCVAVGEADRSFRKLVRSLLAERRSELHSINGLVIRLDDEIIRTAPATPLAGDEIALPDYAIVDLERYFRLNPRYLLDFDGASRGCVFRCTYCYAPSHFGQGERRALADRFVGEVYRARRHGARHLFFVQDNFVNFPDATVALCSKLSEARTDIAFHCYATLAQLTAPVVSALGEAGCRAVYVGVDVVHSNARREFRKSIFRSREDMLERIDLCVSHGIQPTLAFLVREPELGREEFEDTVAIALAARLRGCPVRLNGLVLYPGTEAYDRMRHDYSPDPLTVRLMMDLPEIVLRNEWANDMPHLFPFHSTHRPPDVQRRFQARLHALYTLVILFPQILERFAKERRVLDVIDLVISGVDAEIDAFRPAEERRRTHVENFIRLVPAARGLPVDGMIPSARFKDSKCP